MCVCVCLCVPVRMFTRPSMHIRVCVVFHKLLNSHAHVHCNFSPIVQNETLILFVQDGNIANVKRLFDSSFATIDLRARDVRTGKTALVLAAERNLTEVIGMMLQHPTFDPTLTDTVSRVNL